MEMRLWLVQRTTALIMVPLVLGHLAVIVYAVQGGLSAEEILARTRGSLFWGAYYGLFVLAAAVHGAIGLRSVLREAAGISATAGNGIAGLFGGFLIFLGLRAVYAVVIG